MEIGLPDAPHAHLRGDLRSINPESGRKVILLVSVFTIPDKIDVH